MLDFWGFDFTSPNNLGWSGGSPTAVTVRNGTRAMSLFSDQVISPQFSNIATAYMGGAYNVASLTSHGICGFREGSNDQITVTRESDGSLAIRRGGVAGTILAQSAANVISTAGIWYHIQLSATIHGSAGAAEVRVNGNTVVSVSGVNTSASGNNFINKIFWERPAGINTATVDDVWVSDTAFQGDCKVETTYPNADGATNNWTPSGAANRYQCVDEANENNGDTDYVLSGNVGDIQLFDFAALVTTQGTVKGAKFNHTSRKDDAGTREVKGVIRSNSINSERSTVALSETYQVLGEATIQDPTDSLVWTIAKANAVQFGVKVQT